LVLVVPEDPLFVPPLAFGFGFAPGTVMTSPQSLYSNRFPAAASLTRNGLEQDEQLTWIMVLDSQMAKLGTVGGLTKDSERISGASLRSPTGDRNESYEVPEFGPDPSLRGPLRPY